MAANPTLGDATSPRSFPILNLPLVGALRTVGATCVSWFRASAARRKLDELDDRMLLDAGFDPQEVRLEAEKPFWAPLTLVRTWDRKR